MQRNGFYTSKQIQPCYITVRMQLQKQYKIIWTENKCERSCKLKRTVASDKSGGHVTRHVARILKISGIHARLKGSVPVFKKCGCARIDNSILTHPPFANFYVFIRQRLSYLPPPRVFHTNELNAAPINGATMKSQSCSKACPPSTNAGPMLRAGFTEVPVIGIQTM